ncbi:hypothetical protein M378DRAFT_162031 [Amanita muscaria Koide BX008]|uniref:Uncharacterized protein n=1 Tax=Amanita muscaria (strain Koide BX008) TaxID=946122 RepID=A0A0C2X7X7_AMAMK|nr:hypothetical protein M378DRAFT_162031 [Amanita muscaria Koide BX008]
MPLIPVDPLAPFSYIPSSSSPQAAQSISFGRSKLVDLNDNGMPAKENFRRTFRQMKCVAV